ncbi:membrane-spanning 4-domains subfamily A member 4A-like isoform X2 [Clinocottus analis]
MTSTSITSVGGMVVVTQVYPQDTSVPLQTTQETPPPAPPATPTSSASKMDDMTAVFLRGEPRNLGIVQVFVGLLCVLFSLTSLFSPVLILHAPLSLAVTFVVSGSLAVAAAKQTSVSRVWASLVSGLLSALLGLAGVAYLCWLLALSPASKRLCDSDGFQFTGLEEVQCSNKLRLLNVCVYGLQGVLLVLLVLQVCVSVTVSVFSVRALRRGDGHAFFKASHLGSGVTLLDSE